MTKTTNPTRVQMGRKVQTLPTSTSYDKLRARLTRSGKSHDELQVQKAEQARGAIAAADAEHARKVRDVVLLAAGRVGLTGLDVERLANSCEHARRLAMKAQKPFDAYAVISARLADLGHGVRPGSGENPLDAARHLPPSSGTEARAVMPGAPGTATTPEERLEQERQRKEWIRKREEEVRRDREAYRAALAKYGLLDPAIGSNPGSNGGTGLGF